MNDVLEVYNEDLWDGKKAGFVKAQGNMGGLVVRVVTKATAASTTEVNVHVKAGEDKEKATTEILTFKVDAVVTPVKAHQVLKEVMLPYDVARIVTADVKGAGNSGSPDANVAVTLGYLPR